ncbi:hypothetical protein RN04_08055 [Arthrobacter sp. W1]|nr:hypothetical protein RN04_08055 [Arthrobacter sp. W1]
MLIVSYQQTTLAVAWKRYSELAPMTWAGSWMHEDVRRNNVLSLLRTTQNSVSAARLIIRALQKAKLSPLILGFSDARSSTKSVFTMKTCGARKIGSFACEFVRQATRYGSIQN